MIVLTHPFDPPRGFHRPHRRLPSDQQQSATSCRSKIAGASASRLGPLRQGPSAGRRLSVSARPLVGPVQPERAQGRLPDHRPAHVSELHRQLDRCCSSRDRCRRRRRRSRARERPVTRRSSSAGPNQFCLWQYFRLSLDLFHGDAAFKPVDWRVKLTPVFNVNYLDVERAGRRQPRRAQGHARAHAPFIALQEWFVETKLADLSPDYDFVSVRAGSQPFVSDFRGFIFSDINRGVRLFGTATANRDQFNLAFFDQPEKDTNSGLNTFDDRAPAHRSSPTTTARTSSCPATRPSSASTTTTTSRRFKFDKQQLPGPARPGRRLPAAPGRRRLPRLGRRRAHQPLQHHARRSTGRSATTRSTRSPTSRRTSTPRWPPSNCPTTATGSASARRSSGPRGDGNLEQQPRHRLRRDLRQPELRRRRVQLLAAAGDPAVRRQPEEPRQPGARPAVEQDPGPDQLRQPRPAPVQRRLRLRLTPKLRMINNVNFLWFDNTDVLEQFTFQRNISDHIGTDLASGPSTARC